MKYNEDGKVVAESFDLLGIIQDMATKRFHPTFFTHEPEQGSAPADHKDPPPVVRIKATIRKAIGLESFEEAVQQLQDIRELLVIDDSNVLTERADVFELVSTSIVEPIAFFVPVSAFGLVSRHENKASQSSN